MKKKGKKKKKRYKNTGDNPFPENGRRRILKPRATIEKKPKENNDDDDDEQVAESKTEERIGSGTHTISKDKSMDSGRRRSRKRWPDALETWCKATAVSTSSTAENSFFRGAKPKST